MSSSCKAGCPCDVEVEVFRGINKHVQIAILLIWSCHKVNSSVVAVVLLRQTEGKLVIYQQSVITGSLQRIALIAVLHLTHMAAVSFDALGGTETLAIVGVAHACVTVALTGLTAASVCGVAIITGDAALTLFARSEILTSLTHTFIHTRAVAITLTRWALDEGPVVVALHWAQAHIQHWLRSRKDGRS